MSATELRIALVLLGLIVLLLVYFLGRPKRAEQGWRSIIPRARERRDPTMPEFADAPIVADDDMTATNTAVVEPQLPQAPRLGVRDAQAMDLIISLHVMAKAGTEIRGPEFVVAAEKASLVFGDRDLYHRMVDGKPELGPIYSVVNRVKPGSFDLSNVQNFATPGVSFFMTLPGPLSALDAWERMQPAAARLAELLDAQVFDDQMTILGRQRIAAIRDDLRAYDRKRSRQDIRRF
jgi:cell division protein ZipA